MELENIVANTVLLKAREGERAAGGSRSIPGTGGPPAPGCGRWGPLRARAAGSAAVRLGLEGSSATVPLLALRVCRGGRGTLRCRTARAETRLKGGTDGSVPSRPRSRALRAEGKRLEREFSPPSAELVTSLSPWSLL